MGKSHRNGIQEIKTALIPMGSTNEEEVPEELLQELNLPKSSEEPYKIYIIGAPQWPQVNQYILVHGLPAVSYTHLTLPTKRIV